MQILNGFQHGINLGGWFSQGENSEKHYREFVREKDFVTIKAWGLDHVRVPIDYLLLESEGGILIENGFHWVEQCLQWCKKYHLHCILELHQVPGYTGIFQAEKSEFIQNLAFQARYISLWKEIAQRFSQYRDILAFELLDEMPEADMEQAWDMFLLQAIHTISDITPEIPILLGGIYRHGICRTPKISLPSSVPIVFSFRFYEPFVFTHQRARWIHRMRSDFHIGFPETMEQYRRSSAAFNKMFLTPFLYCKPDDTIVNLLEANIEKIVEIAQESQVPLYCCEYGVINQADCKSTLEWFTCVSATFEKHQIGRAAWNYRELDFGLTDFHMRPIINQIVPLL